jgi:hypothetical protein
VIFRHRKTILFLFFDLLFYTLRSDISEDSKISEKESNLLEIIGIYYKVCVVVDVGLVGHKSPQLSSACQSEYDIES